MPRYFFVLPDVVRPVGGVNVVLEMVEILCAAGYEAALLNADPDYRYPFRETTSPRYFHAPLADVPASVDRPKAQLRQYIPRFPGARAKRPGPQLQMRHDDVFVLPEFWYPEYGSVFPDHRRLMVVQDVYGFVRALKRDLERKTPTIETIEAVISTSYACVESVAHFTGRSSFLVSQSVRRPTLNPVQPKKRQIAYMVRKRPVESRILHGCTQGRPAFASWTFRPIDHLTRPEVDQILSESLIFLSFSEREGFGLPPAEAMAAGCLVIGYTGVGGEEYFTPDVAYPIPDADITRFAEVLEAVVTEYDATPERLDALRAHAANTINTRYTPIAMQEMLLSAWADLEVGLSSVP